MKEIDDELLRYGFDFSSPTELKQTKSLKSQDDFKHLLQKQKAVVVTNEFTQKRKRENTMGSASKRPMVQQNSSEDLGT